MARKTYYKLNITDKDNKQQFCPENFESIESAKEYFKTIEHLAKSACIMLYRNDLNVCNWFWGAEYKNWV